MRTLAALFRAASAAGHRAEWTRMDAGSHACTFWSQRDAEKRASEDFANRLWCCPVS